MVPTKTCGLQVGGMHPTGMLSCLTLCLDLLSSSLVFGSLHIFSCWDMLLVRVFHDKERIYVDIIVKNSLVNSDVNEKSERTNNNSAKYR